MSAVVLLGIAVAFALFATPARAELPGLDAGGEFRIQLFASVETPGDLLRSGGTLPVRVQVVDQYGAPVPDVLVAIEAANAVVEPRAAHTDDRGVAAFVMTTSVHVVQDATVVVTVTKPGTIAGEDRFVMTFLPATEIPIARAETLAGLGLLLLALFATTEVGKYGLFSVAFPLYTRLRKEEVLDHFVRGQIYGYIMSHPGEHYNSLRVALKITNGTLAHHLRTLEMQGFIQSYRDGVYKRFCSTDVQVPRDEGIRLSDLQHHILDFLRGDRGPTQQDIADSLAVSQQTVSYNLRHLSREGLVRTERVGRATRYFAANA